MTAVDLSGLVNLSFLDLRGNRLPSLAGLLHCGALLQVAVDGNRLTRLSESLGRGRGLCLMGDTPTRHSASLMACRRLQKLTADGNLIINSTVRADWSEKTVSPL